MKKIILILSVIFFFTGCNEEETEQENPIEEQENSIYGTWQLIAKQFGNDGSEKTKFGWNLVSDLDFLHPVVLTLNKDNTFSSDIHRGCIGQTFDIKYDNKAETKKYNPTKAFNNSLILYVKCTFYNNKSERIEKESEFEYEFIIENGELILNPAWIHCYEGCMSKFKKIASK